MENNSLLDQKIGLKTTTEFSLAKHGRDELLLVRVLLRDTSCGKDADEQELVLIDALASMQSSIWGI
jgi:hypothetical protein